MLHKIPVGDMGEGDGREWSEVQGVCFNDLTRDEPAVLMSRLNCVRLCNLFHLLAHYQSTR
jgi:hypothetical protein